MVSSASPFPSRRTTTPPALFHHLATLALLLSILTTYPPAVRSATHHVKTTMCTTDACTDVQRNGRTLRGPDGHRRDYLTDVTGSEDDPGCKEYVTPLDRCYNARILFPGDDSWSPFDIYDELEMRSLKRRFFDSVDGTCRGNPSGRGDDDDGGEEDAFVLPFDVCVGPFGPPRPWGTFTLLDERDREDGLEEETYSSSR